MPFDWGNIPSVLSAASKPIRFADYDPATVVAPVVRRVNSMLNNPLSVAVGSQAPSPNAPVPPIPTSSGTGSPSALFRAFAFAPSQQSVLPMLISALTPRTPQWNANTWNNF